MAENPMAVKPPCSLHWNLILTIPIPRHIHTLPSFFFFFFCPSCLVEAIFTERYHIPGRSIPVELNTVGISIPVSGKFKQKSSREV